MTNRRIRVTYGLTISLGEMEFFKADASLEGDLEPNETLSEAYKDAWKVTKSEVLSRIKRVRKRIIEREEEDR